MKKEAIEIYIQEDDFIKIYDRLRQGRDCEVRSLWTNKKYILKADNATSVTSLEYFINNAVLLNLINEKHFNKRVNVVSVDDYYDEPNNFCCA